MDIDLRRMDKCNVAFMIFFTALVSSIAYKLAFSVFFSAIHSQLFCDMPVRQELTIASLPPVSLSIILYNNVTVIGPGHDETRHIMNIILASSQDQKITGYHHFHTCANKRT